METFQLLSAGGVRFDKTKYEKDVRLFSVRRIESHLPSRTYPQLYFRMLNLQTKVHPVLRVPYTRCLLSWTFSNMHAAVVVSGDAQTVNPGYHRINASGWTRIPAREKRKSWFKERGEC